MDGLMMNYPLSLVHLLERVNQLFGKVEVVSRLPDRSIHRYTYAEFYRRSRQLAKALTDAGVQRGDRVATLMWNSYRHLEAYFGIPACGGVVHTLNLRLHPSDLGYIAKHAGDRILIVDDVLLPLYEQFKEQAGFERVVVVGHGGQGAKTGLDDYEEFIARGEGDFEYPKLDENEAAAMCYTSGTTGKPKGVLYSHRALVLHSFAFALPDAFGVAQKDVLMALAPMFHANSHGIPYVAVMLGTKLVLPGSQVDAENLLELMDSERVTVTTAVPTVWGIILEGLEKNPGRWKLAPNFRGLAGGSAPPESLLRRLDAQGVSLLHLWGMTETTPAATVSRLKSYMRKLPIKQKYAVRCRQGWPLPFVEMRAMAPRGEAPWDGETAGELQVRGPWVAASYYNMPEEARRWTKDGWFCTGDVCTIDAEGFMKIMDRSKDMIKSGGEWISSVDLESALMDHPAVRQAAVVAVPHPKWDERPLAVIVRKEGVVVAADDLRSFLSQKFSKWQLPDAFVFVETLPHTSTGKLLKSSLREQYKAWKWETPGS
ncbi:MAG: long-chain fatty acid--CoA ligase [Acidobacteriia bacterium]|nr:long-chain fatty acid--CoA ligase [Terriglobia bacterium]